MRCGPPLPKVVPHAALRKPGERQVEIRSIKRRLPFRAGDRLGVERVRPGGGRIPECFCDLRPNIPRARAPESYGAPPILMK